MHFSTSYALRRLGNALGLWKSLSVLFSEVVGFFSSPQMHFFFITLKLICFEALFPQPASCLSNNAWVRQQYATYSVYSMLNI